MKNILAFIMLVSAGFLCGADDVTSKIHSTTHYLDLYTQDLKNPEVYRLDVGCLVSVHKNNERIPAWIALDVIKRYQLPGYEVVPQLPIRNSLGWTISDAKLAAVVQHIITKETIPFILAKRQASTWCSLAGWAADYIPSIAASAKQSQLDALCAEIAEEYKSPCVAAKQSDRYKKTDGDDLLSLLPKSTQ